MGDYRDLQVWQKARALRQTVYHLTESFPREERYGLRAQMRGAAVSIMSNLAEGCGRGRDGELLRYVSIALGSATELESHLICAADEGFLEAASRVKVLRQTDEIKRMLAGLADYFRGS